MAYWLPINAMCFHRFRSFTVVTASKERSSAAGERSRGATAAVADGGAVATPRAATATIIKASSRALDFISRTLHSHRRIELLEGHERFARRAAVDEV
ncbi:hypothetical protein GCM10009850_071820 [Nonomuraea monospora]|uniref:Uncharacterized protein n=1 Tax=Nonomuraea monospora TaxID=568818 RepID=A0ABP5PLK1_9ACTN